MEFRRTRNVGLSLVAAGVAAVVFAVLLVGLTTDTGAIDWVSTLTAVAGAVVAGEGLYVLFHTKAHTV
jgi:hypothetical protein